MSVGGIDKAALAGRIRRVIDKKDEFGKLPNLIVVKCWQSIDGEKVGDPVLEEPIREPGSTKLMMTVDRIVEMVEERCVDWAEKVGGHVKFTVRMFREGSSKPAFVEPLGVYVDDTVTIDHNTGLALGELQPTKRGEYAQELRHRENMARMHIDGVHQNVTDLRQENRELRSQINLLMANNIKLVKIMEEAQSQAHQRLILSRESEQKQEMLRMVIGKFIAFAPILVQAIAGGKGAVINTGTDLQLDALRGMYFGLSKDQQQELGMMIMQFVSKLDPAHQAVATKIYSTIMEDQKNSMIKAVEQTATSMPSMLGIGG